jgi:hypothetical protein
MGCVKTTASLFKFIVVCNKAYVVHNFLQIVYFRHYTIA